MGIVSGDGGANEAVRIIMALFFQQIVNILRNVTSIVITFSKDRIRDNPFQKLQIIRQAHNLNNPNTIPDNQPKLSSSSRLPHSDFSHM